MREQDLKRILQQPYNLDNWKDLLPSFFKKIDYLSRPQPFAIPDEKIRKGEQVGHIK
jgi:hypothetical protein